MQINRLFEIIYLLLRKQRVTAAALAAHFEVSVRTIYRDLDILSGAGIPVYAVKGKNGGIGLLPDFVLNKTVLTEEEQLEILFALQSLNIMNSGSYRQVLDHVSALFQKENKEWVLMDFSGWDSPEEEREKFRLLKRGILERKMIQFCYRNAEGEASRRYAEPMKLHFKNAAWYLQAYCLKRNTFRTFKIVRMSEVVLQDKTFVPRGEVPRLLQVAEQESVRQEVELWFSKKIAGRIQEEFNSCQLRELEDGNFIATVLFPKGEWMYSYLLSFGPEVRVRKPEYIKKALCEKAKAILQGYE